MKLVFAAAIACLAAQAGGCNETTGNATAGTKGSNEPTLTAGGGGVGHERGDCRPDKSCDANLLCLSNVCVKPPGANCTNVAEVLASIDLGNYAEPEDRAPVVDKYKAQCETLSLTKDEGDCLSKVKDRWAAAQCAPRVFPAQASPSSGNDCALVADKVKAFIEKSAGYVNNAQMKPWFDTTIRVMREACEQDGWPAVLTKCILQNQAPQNPSYFQTCQKDMPPALQQKLQQRMSEAFAKMQAQQRTP